MVGTLPAGTKGFDCNEPVTPHVASLFWDHGYRFAVRYVRRAHPSRNDLSLPEITGLLKAGLGLMVVQHVALPGWHPTGSLGASYGAIAAEESRMLGIPQGVSVWCDLEGVARNDEHGDRTDPRDVLSFCNEWYTAVKLAGYDPGLYVGDSCILTAHQLYYNLKFRRYWSAYNLNRDQLPEVRSVCMWQGAYPPVLTDEQYAAKLQRAEGLPPHQQPHRRVPGVPFEYDTDVIEFDGFKNLPSLLLPTDPG